MLHAKLNPLYPRTKREIVVEGFPGLGKLVIPKDTWVFVHANGRNANCTPIIVDAYVGGSSVFCGVQLDADDIEPAPSV